MGYKLLIFEAYSEFRNDFWLSMTGSFDSGLLLTQVPAGQPLSQAYGVLLSKVKLDPSAASTTLAYYTVPSSVNYL